MAQTLSGDNRSLTSRSGAARCVLFAALICLIIVTSWLLGAGTASAHARLVQSDPEAGSLLDAPPRTLRLEWSETVSLQFSSIQVYDRTRKEQTVGALGQPQGEDNVLKASLPNTLQPGTYTVVWRVVSGVDGHLTAGSFAFRVRGTGAPSGDAGPVTPDESLAEQAGDASTANPFRWVVRALMLAGAILLLGGALFVVGVASPSIGETGEAGRRLAPLLRERFGAAGSLAALTVLLALLLDLIGQIMAINRSNFLDAANSSGLAWSLLTSTRYGFAWLLKFFAAVALLGVMLFVWRKPRTQPASRAFGPASWDLAVGAGSLLILGQSLSSHAAAVHTDTTEAAGGTAAHVTPHALGLPIPVFADWLHMAAAALWAGGLLYMALVLFPAFRAASFSPDERRAYLAAAIPRFSRLAILGVVILAASGTYGLLLHSNDPAVILGSDYGLVLALKLLAFGVLVAIGAINLLRLSPRLRASHRPTQDQPAQSAQSAPRSLLSNVRVEAVLAVVALVAAGGLTLLPPPAEAGTARPGAATSPTPGSQSALPTPIPTPGPARARASVGGYNLSLTVRPSLEGDRLDLLIEPGSAASTPLTDVRRVLFRVTPQDVDAGSTSYSASPLDPSSAKGDAWTATEPFLTIDGVYLVTAIVQRTEQADIKAGFRLTLSESSLSAEPVGIVEVRLTTDPSPPISGTATLKLSLRDGEGGPVEGARVIVTPLMPAHAHIEPPGPAQPVAGEPGAYTFNVHFIMGGAWLIIFNIERDGQPPIKTDAGIEVIGPEITPIPKPAP